MIKKYNQYIKENIEIDPFGEEDWEDDSPIIRIAKKQGLPLDQITELYCDNNRLTSLEGIEKLTNLKNLDCSFNRLTNLDGIENLINLIILHCYNNNFSDDYKSYLKKLKIKYIIISTEMTIIKL